VSAAAARTATLLAALITAAALAAAEPQPLRLTVAEAIVTALARNRDLRVQRIQPAIVATDEDIERAAFDPTVDAEVSIGRTHERVRDGADTFHARVETRHASIGLRQDLPTGTALSVQASTTLDRAQAGGDAATSSVGLTVSQALLRGLGPAANLARVRQARLEHGISLYELRGYTSALVASVEDAYWSHAVAVSRVGIVRESLALAERSRDEVRGHIEVGTLAAIELHAAEAELAWRREDAIAARAQAATTRLRLLDLVEPEARSPLTLMVELGDEAGEAQPLDDVDQHVAVALRLRPELDQARLRLRQGDLALVETRNGLLPRLDLFATLGGSGYADSFSGTLDQEGGGAHDLTVGLRLRHALGNRAAEAVHRRATLGRAQSDAAIANLERLVELDVRLAHVAASESAELIAASAATVSFQQAKLDAETEKLRVGTSTSLAVAQAQRDLVASRLGAAETRVRHRRDLAALHRADGSLLARRGIDAPGAQPGD